jgi:hypothetical protein
VFDELRFDDRDFALADHNETRKIWAEKYLELEPNTAEAEHFALYRSCLAALTAKLTNEARTPFVVPGPLDPAVESSNTLRPYAWALDRGETLVGLTLKSGPFVTTVPAVERRNGHCVLHFLSMSPLPSGAQIATSPLRPPVTRQRLSAAGLRRPGCEGDHSGRGNSISGGGALGEFLQAI